MPMPMLHTSYAHLPSTPLPIHTSHPHLPFTTGFDREEPEMIEIIERILTVRHATHPPISREHMYLLAPT